MCILKEEILAHLSIIKTKRRYWLKNRFFEGEGAAPWRISYKLIYFKLQLSIFWTINTVLSDKSTLHIVEDYISLKGFSGLWHDSRMIDILTEWPISSDQYTTVQRANRTGFCWFEFSSVPVDVSKLSSGSVRFDFVFDNQVRVWFDSSTASSTKSEINNWQNAWSRTIEVSH
jgi:hypothetical protein